MRKRKPSQRDSAIEQSIEIHGAREHNLKNLTLKVPRNQFVVITGVSGSGKSTLAFDLLFAEGQRRFLDAMNVYARQYVEQLSRPDVDLITGIPPTVSIEQRTSRGGGKSTVATVTEIYHFLRLLFARLGVLHCPDCKIPVQPQTRDEVMRRIEGELAKERELTLLAPVVRNRKGFHTDLAEWAARHGYEQIRADGRLLASQDRLRLDRFREHDVEIVTGHLTRGEKASHVRESIDRTLELGTGTLFTMTCQGSVTVHSTQRACPKCQQSFAQLDPKNFSYNSPQGWCPECRGFGETFYLPEVDRGARAEAIEESWFEWQEGQREICPECGGARLNKVARSVVLLPPSVSGPDGLRLDLDAFARMAVEEAARVFRSLRFQGPSRAIARDLIPEIAERLKFLAEVGLGYLELGRAVPTLSGGEAQRIRLAAQLGSNLSGVLYILDEPTIGLHPRDNDQLLGALQKLRSRGNSVLVVEHDEETMRRADHIIDLGPGAGVHGGEIAASGTLQELLSDTSSITGRCLAAKRVYPTRGARRPVTAFAQNAVDGSQGWLEVRHAKLHNLRNITVRLPLRRLVLVTGVSGSGKSTLIRECMIPALEAALAQNAPSVLADAAVAGYESLKAVYEVDQSPIGRTPRSIPATYVGFFDQIRQLFSQVPESRLRGYSPSRFSFNGPQGRCLECEGAGTVKLEMNFLPPAFVCCESCQGKRFNPETLDILYSGKNIAEVLELSVEQALDFFSGIPRIRRPLQALCDTGLGYLRLGQRSPTLSGGEAQRVKLVSHLLSGLREPELFDDKAKHNLFVLEEPTIGLHMADVDRLVGVLQRLVDAGHSVIVIEHNLDLIAEADWIVDLGPEGGDGGGRVVAEGTPEVISQTPLSHTGRFLKKTLGRSTRGLRRPQRRSGSQSG